MSHAEELGARITELCSQIYAAEHRLLALIREFDSHEYWSELGLASCAHWLNLKCGIGMNAAREKVRVAHALAGLPKISACFAKGELSFSKVRAITRIADEKNEDDLLMIAEHGTAHHVEKLVSQCRRVRRLQEAEDADAPYRNRELTHYYDDDGCLVIKARLPAEQGALVVKALEMAMDQDFGDGASKSCPAQTPLYPAEGHDVTAVTSERDEEREPIAARRADALAAIAETFMNNSESSGSTADRYQVVVHVTAETSELEDGRGVEAGSSHPEESGNVTAVTSGVAQRMNGGAASAGRARCGHVTAVTSHLEDGPYVAEETSRRIGCDCSIVHMGGAGNIGEAMSIGRRSRTIPPPMRRALAARDGGCRFPGCTHTRFVDGHHIEHWADGGETSLDNLVLLCRHHHHLVHEGGFECEKTTSGEVIFKDRSETRLPTHWALPGIAAEDYERWLDNEFFEPGIKPDACVARWRGERMDYQMAVSGLMG